MFGWFRLTFAVSPWFLVQSLSGLFTYCFYVRFLLLLVRHLLLEAMHLFLVAYCFNIHGKFQKD